MARQFIKVRLLGGSIFSAFAKGGVSITLLQVRSKCIVVCGNLEFSGIPEALLVLPFDGKRVTFV